MTLYSTTPLGSGLPNIYLDANGNLILQPDLADAYTFRIKATGEVVTNLFPETINSVALTSTTLIDNATPASGTGYHSAMNGQLTVLSDLDYNNLAAISGAAVFQGGGEIEALTGFGFLGRVYGATGSLVKNLRGANVEANAFSGSNIGVLEALRAKIVATTATIDDLYGINIDLELLGTLPKNNYGLRIVQSSSLDPDGGGVGRALDIQSEFSSSFKKRIGIGSTFATNEPQASLHISNNDPVHIRVEQSSGLTFDMTHLGFLGSKFYNSNPFGAFFPATVFIFDCAANMAGGRLLEIRNGGTPVAYIASDGTYVKL